MSADSPQKCPFCDGQGWYVVPAHAPDCGGECQNCPIPTQELCRNCDGEGVVKG